MRLFTLLLMLPVFCFGQEPYPIQRNLLPDIVLKIPKQDTIPVIMLVCDTLKRQSENVAFYETSPQVWWKPGFVVRQKLLTEYPKRTLIEYNYPLEQPIYLDRRKKPLDSWIVVWMVKELPRIIDVQISGSNEECKHRAFWSTMMDCDLPPCNTCTCQSCDKSWPCN